MKSRGFNEEVFFSTVRITTSHESGIGASIGTGFIVKAAIPDFPDKYVFLLVSNRHVYGDRKQKITFNFHQVNPEDEQDVLLENIIEVAQSDFASVFIPHPDNDVDLACLNISFLPQVTPTPYLRTIDPSMLADQDALAPQTGADIWFVGYPENRFDTAHNLPLLRRGYIASIPTVDFNKRKEFVIDAQVFRGSSGSSVFAIVKNEYKLIGVVAQTMIRHEQPQAVPAVSALGVAQMIGLGIVLKSTLVTKLIDAILSAIQQKLRDASPEPVISPQENPAASIAKTKIDS